jgi:thioredoxin reductase
MESWRAHMPAGMLLKSEGFASDLYDPERTTTLRRFCAQSGLPYADLGVPVPLKTMVAYGLDFQERLVPSLEKRMVTGLHLCSAGFQLELDDGETFNSRRVIVAVGHRHFPYVPSCMAHLPPELMSHSSEHHDLGRLKGRDVTVVGGGASALDLATLLHENGADVRLLVRQPSVSFVSKPRPRTLWCRVRYPMTGIGGGWKSRLFTDAPGMFRFLPQEMRSHIVKTHLGPAGAWFIQDRITGRLPVLAGRAPTHAEARDGHVVLHLNGIDGPSEIVTDHVVAATGYRVDLHRLSFLSERLRSSLRSIGNTPVLSRDFESSVPGIYFIGLAAAHWFGPVMRFMFGAGYTARRLSEHLSRIVFAPDRARSANWAMRPGL